MKTHEETFPTAGAVTLSEMKQARFNPELTARIRKYKDAQWFEGNRSLNQLRWMIHDQDHNPVYCDQCGNIANFVLHEPVERYVLKIPICISHAEKWIEQHPGYKQTDLVIHL